jgi:hypothetical protein
MTIPVTPAPIRGRSIRMLLVDGTPTGLIIAEIVNWTGKVIVVPKAALASFLKRKEAHNTQNKLTALGNACASCINDNGCSDE